jgi:hypothetical protein
LLDAAELPPLHKPVCFSNVEAAEFYLRFEVVIASYGQSDILFDIDQDATVIAKEMLSTA